MFLSQFNTADLSRPSFFEMLAQDELIPVLRPALKYVFAVFAQRRPGFEWMTRYSDELFCLGLLVLENHHLKSYDASFAENFYGLKRMSTTSSSSNLGSLAADRALGPGALDGPAVGVGTSNPVQSVVGGPAISASAVDLGPPRATAVSRAIALFCLIGVPYVKNRLDDMYRDLVPVQSNAIPDTWPQRLKWSIKRLFLLVHPWLNAGYQAVFFVYQLLYLYEYTDYYTPLLHLQKTILKRLSTQEIRAQALSQGMRRKERLDKFGRGIFATCMRWFVLSFDSLLDYSKFLLPLSIFLFKFLEWWYAETRVSVSTSLQGPLLPPPEQPKPIPAGLPVPSDPAICAICLHERTNPAIAPSGYVFCYPCIFSYAQDHHKCPITCLPCQPENVRKIYIGS
eukprot:TRINITY_DN26633_c0_g1_i1.p1 TRINITY_DN26633_c0_g1~~TRINITY_DN26633_c0_g1_i1.p1  ORF type:complete len:397 (-),score=-24.61 TRINITY_DN26633_c0_g1_i1:121-1311(-)